MHTKQSLIRDLEHMGLDPKGTVLAHFSYKSLGEVEGGPPQTVIDAMVTYMKDGLMVFPTHTWNNVNSNQPITVSMIQRAVSESSQSWQERMDEAIVVHIQPIR